MGRGGGKGRGGLLGGRRAADSDGVEMIVENQIYDTIVRDEGFCI